MYELTEYEDERLLNIATTVLGNGEGISNYDAEFLLTLIRKLIKLIG